MFFYHPISRMPIVCDPRLLPINGFVPCTVERRLNRFVVEVLKDGVRTRAHINNTGRLLELLEPGRPAACLPRLRGKTSLRLFALQEGTGWALIDTRFQMDAFERAVARGLLPWLNGFRIVARNPRLGASVLDYRLEDGRGRQLLLEVKSAVMRDGDFATYPDCPTERGRRHIREVTGLAREGGSAAILFVCALPGVRGFRPWAEGDPAVPGLLSEASAAGVEVRAMSIRFDGRGVRLGEPDLPVYLP